MLYVNNNVLILPHCFFLVLHDNLNGNLRLSSDGLHVRRNCFLRSLPRVQRFGIRRLRSPPQNDMGARKFWDNVLSQFWNIYFLVQVSVVETVGSIEQTGLRGLFVALPVPVKNAG